jgi:hypothetical protein
MKKAIRIILLIAGCILLIMIVTNPNQSTFKNFAKEQDDPRYTVYKRTRNYFIFSVFTKESEEKKMYIGILGNFFEKNAHSIAKVIPPIQAPLSAGRSVPIPHRWMDDLGTYVSKHPKVTNSELLKMFPQLNGDTKKIVIALAYVYAKKDSSKVDEREMENLFPDLIDTVLIPLGHK